MCLFLMFAGVFPRIGTLLIWLARPGYFTAAFGNTIIWPLLGIIFLPFTTLMYVILWGPTGNLTGWDWLWLILAVVIDVSHYGASAYSNESPGCRDLSPTDPKRSLIRRKAPGENPGAFRCALGEGISPLERPPLEAAARARGLATSGRP